MFSTGSCLPGWQIVKRVIPWRKKNRRQKNRRRQKDKGPPNFNPIYDDHCWFDTPPSTPRPHPVSVMARAMGSFKQKSIRLARGAPAPSPNGSPFRTYTASSEGETDMYKDVEDTASSTSRRPAIPVKPKACTCRTPAASLSVCRQVGVENVDLNRPRGTALLPHKPVLPMIGEGVDERRGLEGLATSASSSPDHRIFGNRYAVVLPSGPLALREAFNENRPESVATADSITLDGRSSDDSMIDSDGIIQGHHCKETKQSFAAQRAAEERGEPHWEPDVVPSSPWKTRTVSLRI